MYFQDFMYLLEVCYFRKQELFITKGLKECLLTVRDGRGKVGKKAYFVFIFLDGKGTWEGGQL